MYIQCKSLLFYNLVFFLKALRQQQILPPDIPYTLGLQLQHSWLSGPSLLKADTQFSRLFFFQYINPARLHLFLTTVTVPPSLALSI